MWGRMGKNKPKIRVDEDFYKLWKKSGYTSPAFTKKLVTELYDIEESKRKNKEKSGWMFKI